MLIRNNQVGKKGLFFVGQDGAIAAELAYNLQLPGKMVIEHTEVDSSLEGKGVGRELVQKAVDFARTHDLKIIPLCPFAKSLFDKTEAWRDVLSPGSRA
jgi:predicted GNAT family acetyltransferase